MLINYLNLFIAVFGMIVTSASMIGPGLIIPEIKLDSHYVRGLLIVNFLYLSGVALEAAIEGKQGLNAYIIMYVSNNTQYFCLYLLSMLLVMYIGYKIKTNGLKTLDIRPFVLVYIAPFILLIVNMFNRMYFYIGTDNLYHRSSLFILSQIVGILCQMGGLYIFIRHREFMTQFDRTLLGPFAIMPIFGSIINVFSGGLNIMAITNTICSLSITLLGVTFWNLRYRIRENELEQLRISSRVGSVWPEFIEQTMPVISEICEEDPQRASYLLDHFAEFLRKAINDLSENRLHPFKEEEEYLRNYLLLEELRFNDQLDINYDIEFDDFEMPSHVLQQSAEWMIRYVKPDTKGVFPMTIHTEKYDNEILIEIYVDPSEDDFQVRTQCKEEMEELDDMRNRLKLTNHGQLEYVCSEDIGTMIKICIKTER